MMTVKNKIYAQNAATRVRSGPWYESERGSSGGPGLRGCARSWAAWGIRSRDLRSRAGKFVWYLVREGAGERVSAPAAGKSQSQEKC